MKGKQTKKTKKSKMKEDKDANEGNKHFIIGDNLRHKAFYEDAIDEFQKALHLQEPVLGSNSTVVARTHYSLGLAFRATKVFAQAMHHLNTAASIYENQGEATKNGEFDTELKDIKLNLARTHHSHGFILQRNGSYDESIVQHRRALAIRENVVGRTHLETARSHYVMGCALSDRGDFDEALGELRRALRVRVMVFAKEHNDVREVIENIGTILFAKGNMSPEAIAEYKTVILRSLEYENEGNILCRKQEYEEGMVCYRKGISLEEQCLGDLHPTTCDLYLRMADALCEVGDLEASLVEYKSAITIYERMMGKFHVKMANIYSKLAGVLMDRGEYETALSFYAKAYGIYDATLGLHDDTKQAMMNLKLAATKDRGAKTSMEILLKAEEAFKKRHPSVSGENTRENGDNDDEEGVTNDVDGLNGDKNKNSKKKKMKEFGEKESKENVMPVADEPDVI